MLGLHSGPRGSQAGTTWVHRCPAGSSYLPLSWSEVHSQELLGYRGPLNTRRGVRSSEMKVTGQVWHRCEPGGHSICQAVPAAAQGWQLVSVRPEGGTGGTGVCLAATHATGSGPSWGIVLSLTSPEMRRLPRTLGTDLHSHTAHAALSCGHCKILATPN